MRNRPDAGLLVVAGREHSRGVASWWQPIDVSDWAEDVYEPRGKRPKRWLRDHEGRLWLRKEPPPQRPHARDSEPAIEVLALQLAQRAGVAVADTRPATWAGNKRGVVSRQFHADDEAHHPGSELLGLPSESGSGPEARQRRNEGRASATLRRVRDVLHLFQIASNEPLLQPFARILAVDAWLGNGDRHSGNWALVMGPRGTRLAPMYDPAACLGAELTPQHPMTKLLTELTGWSAWDDAVSDLWPQFHLLMDDVPTILDEIPDDWLSPARKRFASRLLAHRVRLFY